MKREHGAHNTERRRAPVGRTILSVLCVVCSVLLRMASADPHIDYILNCQGCHGPDGAGAPGAAPSFRGQVAKFLAVPGGREYLVRVPGTARSELNDASTAALLNWLVHEFSPNQVPADFSPYTEEEVTRVRRPALADPGATRRELMHKLAEQPLSASKP